MRLSNAEKLALFNSVFQGRPDCFAVARFGNGPKPIYYPQPGSLAENAIRHLSGRDTLGIYPLLTDNTTWFLAMDFDGEGAQQDATRISDTLALLGVPCYLERSRSGKGMHCWIFFESPVPAYRARLLGKQVVQRAGLPRSFDRFFPSQDFHSGKGVGNLIALPLQGESQKQGNTVFLDPRTLTPHLCQWAVLRELQRLSADELESAILESKEELQFLPLPLVRKTRQEPSPPSLSEKLRVVLAEHVEVIGPYPPAVHQFLKEHSRFANPEWFRRQRIGASLVFTPKFIRVGGPLGDRWFLPRGLWPQLQTLVRDQLEIDDRRTNVPAESTCWQRSINLKPFQELVVEQCLRQEECVMLAPTGAGKTTMTMEILARRAVPSLVLVHNRNLLSQWQQRMQEHLGLSAKEVGGVRGSTFQVGSRVTVATFQSLARRDLDELAGHWSQVVVDECHHVPAKTFAAVVRQLRPRYLLGLTATATRRDQLERLIFVYLGTKVKAPDPQTLERSQHIVLPSLVVRDTALELPATLDHQGRVRAVCEDEERNRLIAQDVLQAVNRGHLVLVLTDRTLHCDRLEEMLLSHVPLATLHGVVGKKAEQHLLDEFTNRRVRVLITTRKRLGEGWDCPPLSTLIVAAPVSGRGSDLRQMIGRLTRPCPDKPAPQVIDYRDVHVPPLLAMFRGRLKAYLEVLGAQRLPEALRPAPRRKGKATLDYRVTVETGPKLAPGDLPRQLSLFD